MYCSLFDEIPILGHEKVRILWNEHVNLRAYTVQMVLTKLKL